MTFPKESEKFKKLHMPTTPGVPQVYRLDKVPTWMKVLIGALSGMVCALGVWVWFLQTELQIQDAKWFTVSRDLARLEGRLEREERQP